MATHTFRAESAPNNPYPNERHPDELSPEQVPEVYSSICKGDCLEPIFSDGACLVFSKTDVPEPGDFVGFWLHPDAIAADEHPRRVKRLYMGVMPGLSFPFTLAPESEVEPVIMLEQLNPPRLYQVRASHILAMHKVIGEAQTNGDGMARMTRQWIDGQMMSCHAE